MSLFRSHRRDLNHKEIVGELRQCGFSVVDLSQVGGGCPDLLVCRNNVQRLVEIKSEDGKLSEDQVTWCSTWNGPSPIVAKSSDEVIKYYEMRLGVKPREKNESIS